MKTLIEKVYGAFRTNIEMDPTRVVMCARESGKIRNVDWEAKLSKFGFFSLNCLCALNGSFEKPKAICVCIAFWFSQLALFLQPNITLHNSKLYKIWISCDLNWISWNFIFAEYDARCWIFNEWIKKQILSMHQRNFFQYKTHNILYFSHNIIYIKVTKSSIYLLAKLARENLCEKVSVSAHGFLCVSILSPNR